MGRTVLAGLVAAILAAALMASAPPAHAAKGMEIAIQDEGTFLRGSTKFKTSKAFDLLDGLQVSRMRFNAVWLGLNRSKERCRRSKPRKPSYYFDYLDAAVDRARARGLSVHLAVTGPAPAWANGKKTCDLRKGADFNPNAKEFGKFAKIVADHFRGRVDQFSVWNEPNRKGWLQPVRSQGTQYRSLYAAGYKAIKTSNPLARVLMGELAPYVSAASQGQQPLNFLRQLTCTNRSFRSVRRCPQLRADGFAHHPYDFARAPNRRYPNRDAVTIANLGSLTSALDKLRRAKRITPNTGSRMNLFLTEYGYFASKTRRSRAVVFSDSRRAKYLVQAYRIALKNSRVKQMLQYLLIQYPGAGKTNADFNFDTSLVSRKGKKTKSYTELSKWATRAAKSRQIKPAP